MVPVYESSRSSSEITEELESQYPELRRRLMNLSLKYQKNIWDAEDAVSETLVQVMQKMEQFEGRSSFSTWVTSIAVHKNLEILRRKRTALDHLQSYMREWVIWLKGDFGDRTSLQGDFRKALDVLDEREQSVFILTVYEELPQKEIAEVLDLSVSNVKVILHRGRKKLMVELRDYFEE
jgi:RNA polymerase sigma-70 factor, ECF subfamily